MKRHPWGFEKALSKSDNLPLQVCDVPPEIEALVHMSELTADDLADLHLENCSDL